ncbi:MAG: phosphoribosylformylglycinamidine synthase II, partial [Acidobacteria bacterium]|nr:phosphoribosylformylglycinamidine synthase II [Acidobacteriota bacterium]
MLLSESQERMLCVATPGRERQLLEIFDRWDLDAAIVGRVTDDQRMRVFHQGEVVVDVPNAALTDEAPLYHRPMTEAAEIDSSDVTPQVVAAFNARSSKAYADLLIELLARPNLASKQWVYRQYDHMVRTNTVVLPGSDAAVIRVKETRRALAMSLDGNGRYAALNPRAGAALAVAESARNVVCSGGQPLAVTNCLNFANPERPVVMRAFSETIDGIAEACRTFDVPVTGGNVSLYNETEGRGIYNTPVIGMLGVIEDAKHITTQWFKDAGDVVLLLGRTNNDLGGSELCHALTGLAAGAPPQLDLAFEKSVQQVCLESIRAGLVKSAHDCSDGGLAVALAESCFAHYGATALGATLDLTEHLQASSINNAENAEARTLALLFAESPSRIVLSAAPDNVAAIQALAAAANVPCAVLGQVGGDTLQLTCAGETLVNVAVNRLEEGWRTSLSSYLDRAQAMATG